ncbi:hypothetical protein BBI01_20730 [Chryseobacterium artocarpi]|uniref:Uncharacterized protein n=2 Tax=Chryseobacterium artocarpi TaxID=1414727 RepID=A0A1B8Z8G4_9FLAO|nr:hypothetical protein [Chryseobacterium artocarpi]OCA67919.1 hypothetical protein BBI01_20730 [Chryseobacterium artocarpi]
MENWEKWDLKYSIAEFVVPRLEAYKKEVENDNIMSIPLWIEDHNLPFILDQNREYLKEEISLINKEWASILQKMISSFTTLLTANDEISFEELQKIQNEGMQLFAKYYFNLWD